MKTVSWRWNTSRALLAAVRRRRGATLVMMSILLVAFLGVGAIAADIGRFYSVVTELQTAADAGALAGALTLQRTSNNPEEADVDTAVVNFVSSTNRADGSQLVITNADIRTAIYTPGNNSPGRPLDFDVVAHRANAVMVTVSAAPVGVFSQLIGRTANLPLSRTGVAWIGNLSGRCVLPWALPYRKLYEEVEGVTGVPDPAPDLEPRDLIQYLTDSARRRPFVVLGPQVPSTAGVLDDGNWAGFNLTGALGPLPFTDAITGGCAPAVLDVASAIGNALPSQVGSYVRWTTNAIMAPGGGICYPRGPDADCYATPTSAMPGLSMSIAWSDMPTGNAVTFRYVGEFILTCYFQSALQNCGGINKPGYAARYPAGTIVGRMTGIKSRTLKPDDVLGIKPSNVQRIILVR